MMSTERETCRAKRCEDGPCNKEAPPAQNICAHPVSAQTYTLEHTSPFQYTTDSGRLTYAQRKFYEDNGFLVIPRLFGEEQLNAFEKRFFDVVEGRVPVGEMVLMKEVSYAKAKDDGIHSNYRLQDVAWDEVLCQYILNPKLLDYVESFTGPNIASRQFMLIFKPPDFGTLSSRHPPHQDMHYFPFRPIDRIVAAWTAMGKTTSENGCLYVVPGSHKGPLLPHGYPKWEGGVNKGFHAIQDYEERPNTIELRMEKGDTVFFHPLLIHGSGPNLTKDFRKAISCHFSSSDCYFINAKGTMQEEVGIEVEDMCQKPNCTMDFGGIWKEKTRHVRGPKAQL